MKYLLINFIVLGFFFIGCKKEQSANDKLLAIINDSLKVEQRYDKIFILQEYGCNVCNGKFANYILEKEHLKNELVIISMSNADRYDKEEARFKNIVIDKKSLFYKTNALNYSAAVLLKNNEIDTILNFSDARIYDSNLSYLSGR